ncbi:MAG: LytTR family DNA-binding domain-containing protein [Niabella sp.]
MERPLNCLIVDDNKVARLLLRQILEKIEGIVIFEEFDDSIKAKSYIDHHNIELLFLDIEMPEMSGLELLRTLKQRPLTILTTAKQGYAVEAFELNVVDYIVKPFSLSRVMLAVERAKELLSNQHVRITKDTSSDFVFIKDNKIIRKLNVSEILWVEAKGDYIKIHTPQKSYVVHGSLKAIEDKLSVQKFMRVHRSYIIAIDKIDYIEDRIVYIHNQPIPISESYKEALLKNLQLL